jgi:hypothetical protein
MKYGITFLEWGAICPRVKRNLVYKRKLYSYCWFKTYKIMYVCTRITDFMSSTMMVTVTNPYIFPPNSAIQNINIWNMYFFHRPAVNLFRKAHTKLASKYSTLHHAD